MIEGIFVKIISFEKLDGKMNLIFEDESKLEVTEEDYLSLCLYEREEMSRDEYDCINRNTQVKKARIDAIKFISYKIRACKEVYQRLEKLDYGNEIIELTIESLIKDKYLDDLDYARRYTRTKIKLNKISRKQLEIELAQKGIRDDIISAVDELDDIDEYGDIRKIVEKKYCIEELRDSKKKLKAMKYLYSKGYGTELIQKVIDEIINQDC